MPVVGPTSFNDLVRGLRQLGWDGPYPGGRHPYMQQGTRRLVLPNPHQGDISPHFLLRLLRQAGISRATWEAL